MRISKREIATILPALEFWKEELAEGKEWIPESTYFDKYPPLSVTEINELAVRLKLLSDSTRLPLRCTNSCSPDVESNADRSIYDAVHVSETCSQGAKIRQENPGQPPISIVLSAAIEIRLLLGTQDCDMDNKPSIQIRKHRKGWVMSLRQSDAEASAYIHLLKR